MEVALDIYYEWRIARGAKISGDTSVDWQKVKELAESIVRGGQAASQAFHEYVYALALGHMGEWGLAEAMFAGLRRSGLPRSSCGHVATSIWLLTAGRLRSRHG